MDKYDSTIKILKARFEDNMIRHKYLKWEDIEKNFY